MSPVRVKKTRRRAQLSCNRCRLIKRKCDRSHPCGRCNQDEEQCSFDRAHVTQKAMMQRRKREQQNKETNQQHKSQSEEEATSTSKSSSSSSSSDTTHHQESLPLSSSTSTTYEKVKKKQHDHTDTSSKDAESLRRLVAHPIFLERVVHIYFREIGWYTDLVSGTRLHRLVNERHDPRNTWPGLWKEIEILAMATTALVAQACPSDVEAVLVALPPNARQGFCMAEVIAKTAHTTACDEIAKLNNSSTRPQDWSTETHASSVLLRIYDKNDDLHQPIGERILLDIARLQRAKLHQINVYQQHGQINGETRIWQTEHKLLGYRVFWHLLFEDRVVAMINGTPFAIQAKHCNICLHDPFGHVSIQELCGQEEGEKGGGGGGECTYCHGNDQTQLCLDLFSGATTRISVINGRYFEKLSATRTSSFRWPQDAEQMAAQLELDLLAFEADLSTIIAKDPDCLLPGQEDALAMYVARVRRDVAKQLCDGFATSLLLQAATTSTSTPTSTTSIQSNAVVANIDPLAVEWMLEKRKLDTAKDLIIRVMEAPRRLPIRTAFNYLFYSKFIHQQTMELMQGADCWFQWLQGHRHGHLPFNKVLTDCLSHQQYYMDCIRLALAGRNLLVLSSRKSELPAAKRLNVEVVEKCAQVLRQLLPEEIDVGNESSIVNDAAILQAIEDCIVTRVVVREQTNQGSIIHHEQQQQQQQQQHALVPPPPPSTLTTMQPSTNMDEVLNQLFADLPALEQLFAFSIPPPPAEPVFAT